MKIKNLYDSEIAIWAPELNAELDKTSVAGAGSLPRVISDVEVLQKASFVAGPRIGRVQTVEYLGKVTTVNFWYNNDGSLHHVA